MFGSLHTSNCSHSGRIIVETCGIGKFCCIDGCCTDFTYLLIFIIIIAMIATVAIFVYVEILKERRFNEKLKSHIELCIKKKSSVEFEVSRIQLGCSPIEQFDLPPSCSPPMTVPKLKLHRPIHQFLHRHL